jgi:hypothetical protein
MKAPCTLKLTTKASATLLAIFGLAVLASAPAQAEAEKTFFYGEEIGVSQVPGRMYLHDSDIFMFERELVAQEVISDPRLAGTGIFKYTIAANLASWSGAYWGSSRIVPDMGGRERQPPRTAISFSGFMPARSTRAAWLKALSTSAAARVGLMRRWAGLKSKSKRAWNLPTNRAYLRRMPAIAASA